MSAVVCKDVKQTQRETIELGTEKRARTSVDQQAIKEIQQNLTNAGWDIDDSFSGWLLIGFSGDNLSIVAHKEKGEEEKRVEEERETREPDEIVFELLDHQRNLTYWLKEVPTPQRAQELLEEHGELPEKWEEQPS